VATTLQSPSNLKCYSGISAIGAIGPGVWVLGDAFMHNVYSMFDYGGAGSSGKSPPRVGLASLAAAEQAAAAAAFQRALGSKTSSASSRRAAVLWGGGGGGQHRLLLLHAALLLVVHGLSAAL
jgi:hypothetical protein